MIDFKVATKILELIDDHKYLYVIHNNEILRCRIIGVHLTGGDGTRITNREITIVLDGAFDNGKSQWMTWNLSNTFYDKKSAEAFLGVDFKPDKSDGNAICDSGEVNTCKDCIYLRAVNECHQDSHHPVFVEPSYTCRHWLTDKGRFPHA